MTTQCSCTDKELAALVGEKLQSDPNFMPQTLAAALGVSLGRTFKALPEDMRADAPGGDAIAVWEAMTEWEKVTFMAATSGAILEISCRLPKGKSGHGMYNLMGKNLPIGGHLLMDKVDSVCFVSKPLFGLESHSVQFLDAAGNQCFAVYLGRDEKREIIPSVKEGFLALKAKHTGKAAGAV